MTLNHDTVRRAALGSKTDMDELKKLNPLMEFRRFFDDTLGTVVKCRRKGPKAGVMDYLLIALILAIVASTYASVTTRIKRDSSPNTLEKKL